MNGYDNYNQGYDNYNQGYDNYNQGYGQGGGSFYDGSGDDETVLESMGTIPEGDYLCIVQNVQDCQSKVNPANRYYSVEFEVCQGQFMGRKLFNNFNYQNPNHKAVQIGRALMKQFVVAALGTPICQKQGDLLGQILTVRVKIKRDQRGEKNEAVKFGPRSGIVSNQAPDERLENRHPANQPPAGQYREPPQQAPQQSQQQAPQGQSNKQGAPF